MKFIVFCLLCLFCINCNNNDNILLELKGKEIIFPDNITFTNYLNDTIPFNMKGKYKIFTYVSPKECTKCELKLDEWLLFWSELDTTIANNTPFIYVVNTTTKNEIYYLQRSVGFKFPTFIDEKDTLNKLNEFPENNMLQTFLLDKDNKIVLVGNPTKNEAIHDLYIKELMK